jgi:competence protein ComEA
LKEWIKEHVTVMLAAIVVLCVVLFYVLNPMEEERYEPTPLKTEETAVTPEPTSEQQPEKKTIMADVKGAIKNPGVYEAKEGERIIDIITRAGGLTEKADQTKVNFAMYVEDEMVLYIPEIGELESPDLTTVTSTKQNEVMVNINKAEQVELETLPGIGPSKSQAIIEYRNTNGPFKTIEDLQSVSGFGVKTFEKLKDKITVK